MDYILYILLVLFIILCGGVGGFIDLMRYSRSKEGENNRRGGGNKKNYLFMFLGFIFTVITFIFGIHSEVFSSYDNLNKKGYDWFKVSDIIQFPIDQLKITSKQSYDTIVSSEDFKDTITADVFFLVDKTGSLNKMINKEEKLNKVKKLLKNESEQLSKKIDEAKLDVVDLAVLVNFIKKRKTDHHIQHYYYFYYGNTDNGNTNIRNYKTKRDSDNIEHFIEFIKKGHKYKDSIRGKKKKGKKTPQPPKTKLDKALKPILTDAGEGAMSSYDDKPKFKGYKKIVIVSDFENESSLHDLGTKIDDFPNKFDQFGFIKIINEKDKDNCSDIFKDKLSGKGILYFQNLEVSSNQMDYFISFSALIKRKGKVITLYKDWNSNYDFSNTYDVSGIRDKSDYIFSYGCSEYTKYNKNPEFMEINNNRLFPNNEYYRLALNSDSLKINLSTNLSENNSYYLNVKRKNSPYIKQIPILCKNTLSEMTIKYLLILYILFLSIVLFILMEFMKDCWGKFEGKNGTLKDFYGNLRESKWRDKYSSFIVIIEFIVLLAIFGIVICYVFKLCSAINLYVFFIISLFIIFEVLRFVNNEKNKTARKINQKNENNV